MATIREQRSNESAGHSGAGSARHPGLLEAAWSAFVDARRMAIRHEALAHKSPVELARLGLRVEDLPRAIARG